MRGRDLDHPFRGVNVPAGTDPDLEALCSALQTRLPDDAYVCGVTAALLHGLPLPRGLDSERTVHVAVPSPRPAPTGRGIRGHSVRVDPRDVQRRGTFWIGTAARTFCELSAVLELPRLVAVGDYIVYRHSPLASVAAITDAAARYPRGAGAARLRAAVPLIDGGSESPPESMLRVIAVTAGIPGLVANEWIRTSSGHNYRGDLVVRSRKVVIEYQSRFHEAPVDFRTDMTRISRLEADGWVVIQVNADDLDDPGELLARISRVLASRPLAD
jgi:hypothetical protein